MCFSVHRNNSQLYYKSLCCLLSQTHKSAAYQSLIQYCQPNAQEGTIIPFLGLLWLNQGFQKYYFCILYILLYVLYINCWVVHDCQKGPIFCANTFDTYLGYLHPFRVSSFRIQITTTRWGLPFGPKLSKAVQQWYGSQEGKGMFSILI